MNPFTSTTGSRVSVISMTRKIYQDKETLEYLYHEKDLTQKEIADKLGVAQKTVSNWMRKHDIERRHEWAKARTPRRQSVNFRVDEKGYEVWTPTVGTGTPDIPVHQLVAVAEYGFEAVKGKHVHHKNGVRWDTRPDNLALMDPSEHASHHEKTREHPRDEHTGKFISTEKA